MGNMNQQDLENIFGFSESEMNQFIATEYGQKTIEFLTQWAEVTHKSLLANKKVINACYKQETEGHIICIFCEDGIPNWKNENSREHGSDCPINLVTDALNATKTLRKALESGVANAMPRDSSQT